MRRKLIAANWKMNLTPLEARALIAGLRARLDPVAHELARGRDLLIAPAAALLYAAGQALAGSSVMLGAQNMHWEDRGAFTGEVSPAMLRALGVAAVIVGHSERRHIFHESDDSVARKLDSALRHGLTPLLCVGETAQEHDAGQATTVIFNQIESALASRSAGEIGRIVIAYEPVWAIGTGKNATPEAAAAIHAAIREKIAALRGAATADSLRILYGGSVTPGNIDSLLARPDIDGALVGGASLEIDSFARIAMARTV